MAPAINPFRYGREVDVLVDRTREVNTVVRIGQDAGTLFFIGPRRFGKTSVLKAAEDRLMAAGAVVLRYDAEAYESIGLLASALLSGTVRQFASTLDRAQATAKRFFGALRPSLSLDPVDGKITVELGVAATATRSGIPMLTDVLNGIERLATTHKRRAVVIIDEFQQVVVEGGEQAERQIRAAVQTHRTVGYVFAGSRTRMLTDMIATSARAFWQLGDQLHLDAIPRADFVPFLRTGLLSSGAEVSDAAIDRILTVAEDVPYNVQQLASQCWTMLHGRARARLMPAMVDTALREILATQHATYMQRWLSLTTAQKQTLKIVTAEPAEFQLAEVARRHGVPRTTMQRALQLLEERSFVRQEVTRTGMRWRIEDPFFIRWLHDIQEQ